MVKLFNIYFIPVTLSDIVDIAIVALLVYIALRLIRGSRARPMLIGLIVILFGALIAYWLDLKTIGWLVRRLAMIWALVFIILFQTEIKDILTRLGSARIFNPFRIRTSEETIKAIKESLRQLREMRAGALIAIQRKTPLSGVVVGGKSIGAKVTPELIVSIFSPMTPLHDGGIIIRGDRIESAACQFPLTEDEHYRDIFGMRHRAAIGLTENSDAVVVVLSEETGNVSLAIRGKIYTNLSLDELERKLAATLSEKQ
ncbi:diadenylate cyclase CdaA [bacterium]|nr:diadenylate cyclase CdaA [bacterium]